MSDEQKFACNREPFKTTSSCDRGEVDIFTFSDLPICAPIDPLIPQFGPPTVDFPVVPFQPPPCACVNIKTTTDGKVEYRKNKDLSFSKEFKADGDCCEGNYIEKFNIKIPCIAFDIINGNKSHAIDMSLGECGDSTTKPSGSFKIGLTQDKCQLKLDPKIKLKLPRYPTYEFSTGFNLSTVCGITSAAGSFYLEQTGTACEKKFKAKLNLKIPRPPIYNLTKSFSLNTVCGLDSATGTFDIEKTETECGADWNAKLHLNIPKPIEYTFDTVCSVNKVCYIPAWDGTYGGRGDGVYFWQSESHDSCERKITTHLKMNIPCIQFDLSGADKDYDISFDTNYNVPSGKFNLGAEIDCCKIKFNPKVTLKIPQPTKYDFVPNLILTTGCGQGPAVGDFYIDEISGADSTVKKLKTTLYLNIPTPPTYEVKIDPIFKEGRGGYGLSGESLEVIVEGCKVQLIDHVKINVPHVSNVRLCKKAHGFGGWNLPDWDLPDFNLPDWQLNDSMFTLSGGIDGHGSFTLGEAEDSFGYVTGLCPKLKLTMPCPLNKLKIKGDSDKSDRPYVKVEKDDPSSSGCAAKWKANVKMPEGVQTKTIKVLTGFSFTNNRFEPKLGTFVFKNGLLFNYTGDSPSIDVDFAEHNTCN